ncbi:MAG: TetR/AcrR family transcriptional regulator [Eubacteriales bacterium]|nr:TetR/AcrR family transcriptional regulator [Eubacteriales bacterium]
MNERFFDLKKDRQDRIINGALKIITENGYRHASTDEMVSAASISKGLLFHYFKSKIGVYQFLYEYSTRYMMIELREPRRKAGCDFFEMHRLLMKADAAVLRKYPCMPLFLYKADGEAQDAGVELPGDLAGAVYALRSELLTGAQRPPFLTEIDTAEISRILLYARNGIMQELLQKRNADPDPDQKSPARGTASGPTDNTPDTLTTIPDEKKETTHLPLHEEFIQNYTSCLQMMRRLNM